MSDAPQGPGWWQASDDRWYPPEQAPGAADAATTPSGAGAGPTPGAPTGATGPPAITPPPGGWGTAPTSLDIGTALSFGWTRFTQHLGQIAILMAAIVVTMLIFSFGATFVIRPAVDSFVLATILSVGITFVWLAIAFIVGRGLIRAVLAICDGRPIDSATLFDFEHIGSYAITAVLYSVIVGVGYMLCYLPGVIASFVLWFWAFAQVDGQLEPVEALKASVEVVKNRAGEVLVFLLVCGLINFVGALVCGIGLFVTIPVTMIASGYAWRTLNGRPPALA